MGSIRFGDSDHVTNGIGIGGEHPVGVGHDVEPVVPQAIGVGGTQADG